MKQILSSILLFIGLWAYGQPSVKVEVSKDTIGVGEIVELTYTIENGQGRFEPPDLTQLPVISGPNTSSSMLYQNGKMSASQSYSYVIRPEAPGVLHVPQARYRDQKEVIDIESIDIVVTKYIRPSTSKSSPPDTKSSPSKREKRKF